MCLFHRSFLMQGFAAFTILSGAFVVIGWACITQPLPQDNVKAYQACTKLHPQRYCLITYLPSKVETMEKN
jgi:hypothetical protein